jgi:hypothetical protein
LLILFYTSNLSIKEKIQWEYDLQHYEFNYAKMPSIVLEVKVVSHLQVNSDSQLVVNQVKREYQSNEEVMISYLNKVKLVIQKFKELGSTISLEVKIPKWMSCQS